MDWANETYVRLYVRNTTTWRRLGFEGQCMLMHLLRVVDRAGVLDIEDMSPAEAAALHTGAPEEFAERGVGSLLRLETIVHDGSRLIFPNFMEAQETAKSDKQRQKESRSKRATVTKRDDQSQPVTSPSQNVTESHSRSQAVTVGHSASQPVTLSSAQLSSTQPSRPLPIGGGGFDSNGLTRLFSELRHSKGGGKFTLQRSDYDRAQSAIAWAIQECAEDPAGACKRSLLKFFQHATGKEGDGWPFWAWANDPGKWLAYSPKQVVKVVSGAARYAGPSEVSQPEDYAVNGDIKW